MAFVIGWNLILEYVIGTASVARGYSGYIDSLFDGTISSHFKQWTPIHVTGLATYPDPIALGLTLALTVLLAVGVKESIRFATVMTCVNLVVVVFVVIAGLFKVNIDNWKLKESDIPEEYKDKAGNDTIDAGSGGFLPFGFSGMMSGAATCFYAFVGFDAIATTGEEAKNPKKAIPLSIIISLSLIFMAYFGVSAIQTLMLPYYLQNDDITKGAPLPYIFEHVGWTWAKWVVAIGALNGLSTSLLGAMFPLPRVLYAMASDGVIFRFLATIHPRFQTPLYSTLISGALAAAMATLFDITQLADMMSIGTLLAYTLVAESILIIRYSDDVKAINQVKNESEEMQTINQYPLTRQNIYRQIFSGRRMTPFPNQLSSIVSNYLIGTLTLLLVILDIQLVFLEDLLFKAEVGPLVGVGITTLIIIAAAICLTRQPTIPESLINHNSLSCLQVPWVPLVPFLSVWVNIYLMFKLSVQTWIRFAVWMIIGLIIYIFYGIRNSNERKQDNKQLSHDLTDK
ncbi:unnamed protein product [Medioppia subpectinata]|uniref:Cationic amino acid transporter C-terminal domain-containing protein n=1 Tax=Medioppia subpectinata TaxID=1979941 RepID=A0A7R9QBV9_9ACAR|nr:unnamed protein product [Medioppia subpectinata]CAG2117432.1 unnamed protein product [Medioppia subpectinata]